jgi:hypothetical protein
MKALLLSLCLLCSLPTVAQRPVHVRATVTKKGTYKPAHTRTSPNRTQRDNYSAKGNRNPYTGKQGTKTVKR